jgi:hypothetical protein
MQWFREEMRLRNLSQREVGRRMGHANATRIGEYLSQRIVAGPIVLGNLAVAIGVSPIEALWSAGRHEFVLDYLQTLYELGWWWMKTDRVHLDPSAGALFFGHDTVSSKKSKEPVQTDPSDVPAALRHRYHRAEVYNEAGVFRSVALPKPMACAIVLAIGLFPRRGDHTREATSAFLQELGGVAFAYISATERRRVPAALKNLERPLKAANEIAKQRFYGDMQLAVIGEYAHAWANFVCSGYADYARVALYDRGGALGDPGDDGDIWAWQMTAFPQIGEFAAVGDSVVV